MLTVFSKIKNGLYKASLDNASSIDNFTKLPSYAFQFVFKNLGSFRFTFVFLTFTGIFSALLKFINVYLLGDIISNITSLTFERIFYFYLPAWIIISVLAEGFGYILRKYGEAFPPIYGEFTRLRFYLSFLDLKSHTIFNVSKEKLLNLSSKYSSHLEGFLADWIWSSTFRITKFIIILIILFQQDVRVFLANLVYMLLFLLLSFRMSAKFSKTAKAYSEQNIETSTVLTSFLVNLNSIKRLGIRDFFLNTSKFYISKNWERFSEVKDFHAKRWFLQLNLFNFLYIGTLAFGIYQVKTGLLPLGYLVLIKWAFDELWHILVYCIEYYVSLIQQKQDSLIIKEELAKLSKETSLQNEKFKAPQNWKELTLKDISVNFKPSLAGSKDIKIEIPKITIERNSKNGVVGPSGAGKTTLFNIMLNLVNYEGHFALDNKDLKNREIPSEFISVITNSDPLFKLPLRKNIILDRSVSEDRFKEVIKGLKIESFASDFDSHVGEAEFNVSAGQEQRIRLARGLLQDSQIYLLDEPFNGIDQNTKEEIIEFLKKYLENKTLILVTHNPAELKLVDKIYKFENHRII